MRCGVRGRRGRRRAHASRAVVATTCWASTSSGLVGTRIDSMAPERIRSTATAVWARSPRCLGKSTPRDTSPTWWPARPTRWRALATLGGDSIWMTRSTAPMSMPSSRLLVATTQGRRPRLRSSSMIDRCSLETEPWWALAMTTSAPALAPDWAMIWAGCLPVSGRSPPARLVAISLRRAVSRSARRRELAKTMVERCCSTRSTTCSSTCGQIEPLRPSSASVVGLDLVAVGCRHVLDGDDHLEVPGLVGRRGHDVDGRVAAEEPGDLVERPYGRGEADPLGGLLEERVEALEADGEVGAALAPGDGVHLVDDDGVDTAEGLARLRGQHQEQRLGRGDEDVGRLAGQPAPLLGGGVAGPDADADLGQLGCAAGAQPVGGVADAGQRRPQVALDVDPQRLERRDVEHPAALRLLRHRRREQLVERPQERRQRLAGPRRRHDQRVPPGPDRVPRPLLRRRGLRERRREPRPRGFAEALETCLHAFSLAHATDSGQVGGFSGRPGKPELGVVWTRTPSSANARQALSGRGRTEHGTDPRRPASWGW